MWTVSRSVRGGVAELATSLIPAVVVVMLLAGGLASADALLAGGIGVLLGPLVRGQVLAHAVPSGQPWRRHCPACAERLVRSGWRGLLAALPTTGRCPHCRHAIGPRPGLVEVVTGVTLGLLAWRIDVPLVLLALGWSALLGIVLGFVDVAVHRLPDRLTLSAFVGAAVLLGAESLLDGDLGRFGVALAGALAVGGGYLVLVFISRAGMGLGDGKAAFLVGLTTGWFGWDTALFGVFAGFLFAGLFAAVLLILRRVGRRDHLPHGPFLLAGALTAIVVATAG